MGRTRSNMTVVLRAIAWWLCLIGTSFWLLDYAGDESPIVSCIDVPWHPKGTVSAAAWGVLLATFLSAVGPVSYTHLTLPTILRV